MIDRQGGNWLANLGHIQHLLNNDQHYRGRFLKDPVEALTDQGLTLSTEMQQQLRRMVAQAQATPAAIPGAAAGPEGRTIFVFESAGPIRSSKGVPLIIAFE
jgi:hypothetical protein